MAELNDAPSIVTAQANVMGNMIEIISDVNDEFPNGLELVLFRPGQLEPLGRGVVQRGCMVAIVPPGMAEQMRHIMRQQRAQQPQLQGGQVRAPGVKG